MQPLPVTLSATEFHLIGLSVKTSLSKPTWELKKYEYTIFQDETVTLIYQKLNKY